MSNIIEKDVTNLVEIGVIDDEMTFILKCVCGQIFKHWQFPINIYKDYPAKCPHCNRQFYFKVITQVFEVIET